MSMKDRIKKTVKNVDLFLSLNDGDSVRGWKVRKVDGVVSLTCETCGRELDNVRRVPYKCMHEEE